MPIAQTPDIDTVGEAGTGTRAAQLAKDTSPDLLVMDIRMPVMGGIEATRLMTAGPAPPRRALLPTCASRLP
jgi:YesN/AraC family two-component response regulator